MPYAVKLEQFEGPLDLLLDLIESEKLDISQVSLALLSDRYITYIHEHPEISPEDMADFLVVASKLLFIKSKALLPFLSPLDDDGPDLATQLKMYKAYLDASQYVAELFGRRQYLYAHDALPHVDIGFVPPVHFTLTHMQSLFTAVITRLQPLFKIPKAIIEKTISLHEKISHIQEFIRRVTRTSFGALVAKSENRSDIVISFLALLELIKQKHITVAQRDQFTDIIIEKIPA